MKEAKSQKAVPGFDAATGTHNPGFDRGTNKYAHNHWSGHSNDGREVNFGRGPTKGNQDYNAMQGKHAEPPARALPKVTPGKDMFPGSANPQVRTPGGTRAWEPKAGQNYQGNPDRINVSGYSMGDGKMSRGSRPVGPGQTDGINYGPKKQY